MGKVLGARVAHSLQQQERETSPLQQLEAALYGSLLSDAENWHRKLSGEVLRLELSSAELAASLLPLVYCFWDDEWLWNEQLDRVLALWQVESRAAIEVWTEVLRLVLKSDSLVPGARLPAQVMGSKPACQPMRAAVSELLAAGASTSMAVAQLARGLDREQLPIALAIYFFSETPEDFQLSIRRAALSALKAPFPALVGILSGIYNGEQGLSVAAPSSEEVEAGHRATALWGAWAGVSPHSTGVEQLAIGAVGTLQPRSQLRLISQNRH